MMVSLLVVAVLFVVAGIILNILLETSATRRVLGRTTASNEGDSAGAVLMASDYNSGWSSDTSSSDAGGWDASDCGSGPDAGDGGGDCGGDGGGGGSD